MNTTTSAAWRGVPLSARPLSARGAAALEYAAMGWEVFPAPPGQKKSHKSQEHSGAKWGKTTDPEEISADFRKWPDANVAIVTGATSGIFVVEADTVEGHGVDGLASIKALEAKHGPFPETLMAVSPSGSIHRYYRHPGIDTYIKNSTSEIAPGVDVRGDGGMVIAPPSVKPGVGEYRWLNDLPIARAPAWLIDAVTKKEAKKSSTSLSARARTRAKPSFRARPHANVAVDIDEIAAALMAIPNDASVTWGGWNRIGMAVFAATAGSAAGFSLFDRWSQKYPGYSAEDTAAKWAAFESCPPTEIGVGSVFYEADRVSSTWRSDYQIASLYGAAPASGVPHAGADQVECALELFDAAERLQSSLAERYLFGLGLVLPDDVHEILRFHPACSFGASILPCLIALVQDSQTNEPVAVHLTILSEDAAAVQCKTVGSIDCYSVVKLGGEVADRGELTIASSVEAALAALAKGFSPTWSVLSLQGIASFPQPRFHRIKRLNVIVDCEETVQAADQCKVAWGNLIRIVVPTSAAPSLFPFKMAPPAVLL